jgi:putative ABC transport system permease protein
LAKLVVLVLVGLSVAYTSIAIANTLLIATTGRLRDFAVLRLSGATVGQIIAMVAAEAAFAVGIGAALGMAMAWTAVAGVAWGLSKDIGVTIPVTMDWPVTSLVLTGCLLLAVLASMLPARLACGPAPRPWPANANNHGPVTGSTVAGSSSPASW